MACRECRPEIFPQGGKQNDGHLALRLDSQECWQAKAFLDGVDVSDDCTESIPGNPGTVVLLDRDYDHRRFRCECGRGINLIVKHGEVRTEHKAPAEVTDG